MRLVACVTLISALVALDLAAQQPLPRSARPSGRRPAAIGAPPVGLSASGTPSTAVLAWQAPAGVAGFDVYRAFAPGGNWTKLTLAPIAGTTFTDGSGFQFGQVYIYRVVSLFADGSFGNADLQFQPPPPANPTWVTAVQQGSNVIVSWAPVLGATRYKITGGPPAQGYREVAPPGTSSTYQNVPAGYYGWQVGASFDPGAIETGAVQWPSASLSVVAASARYRVLITGLSVVRKTADDPLHYDGIDDEVFVAAQAVVLDRQTGAVLGTQATKSWTYGDINNPPRLQAGSASSHGGLLSGDKLPAGDPTVPVGAATSGAIPLLVFDGILADGRQDLLIFPSVWEVDHGNGTLFNDWLANVPNMRRSTTVAPDPVPGSLFPVHLATGDLWYSAQDVFPASSWQDKVRLDRPIGSLMGKPTLRLLGPATFNFQFQPRVFQLRREEIEPRLATPFIATNGAKGIKLSIEFREGNELFLWGDYMLHLWIERVP